jgi:hypothetical protein
LRWSVTVCEATDAAIYAGDGLTLLGIWKVIELATDGLSLLNEGARELRGEAISGVTPVSECVCRCMARIFLSIL